MLAQAGIRYLKIVDFDCVERSNLDRQFYKVSQIGCRKTDSLESNLKDIFPEMNIEKIHMKIMPGQAEAVFSDCEIVVEGFDSRFSKKMIMEDLCMTDKIVVGASGIAGSDIDGVSVKRIGNCSIVGDFVSCQSDNIVFPPKIAVVSAMMAAIVLENMKG
jgi:sulfur carrier protein ThiS adenylyltransferase